MLFTPLPSEKWNYESAAHLLNRAGFGGTPEEIEAAQKKGMAETVYRLVQVDVEASSPAAPTWAHPRDILAFRMQVRALMEAPAEKKDKLRAVRMMESENILDLRHWWLDQMATTSAPLLEKMTLFWHSHFATSMFKVNDGYWMWKQNDTLRRNAFGNFGTLTKAISRDPAMMIFLDLQQSQPAHPNENWAREAMELFTVGIGHYTEPDIRESARAFTGYRVNYSNQEYRFAAAQHDNGPKTFMGHTGPFGGDDIIDILLEQPACAQFIGRKIWRYFVEDEPSPETANAVAARLRLHRYEIRPLLQDIFTSAEFYSPRVVRSQIKSPVQFLIQTTKLLQAPLPAPKIAQNAMQQMGQILFAPPNVKGWDGGKSWISTSTLLFRYNFANYLINGTAPPALANAGKKNGADPGFRRGVAALAADVQREPIDVSKLIPCELRDKPAELVAHLSTRLFQAQPPAKEAETLEQYLLARRPDTSDETMRGLLHLMMSTPQFQLT